MSESSDPEPLSARVAQQLERLRPMLRADGGDVELVAVDAARGRVELHFIGACSHCPASSYTLEFGLRARLVQELPEVKEVIAV